MASTELSLECKVQSYSMLLKYNSFGDGQPLLPAADPTYYKLQDFVSRLEEERLKIDVFKRELPLCMELLTNAVETSRRQLQACKTIQGGQQKLPVLEEFIPLKNSTPPEDQKPLAVSDKANWMTSVQLWSQASDVTKQPHSTILNESPKEEFNNNNGGGFHPFNKDHQRNSSQGFGLDAEKAAVAEMELFEKAEDNKSGSWDGEVVAMEQRAENVETVELGSVQTTASTSNTTTQTNRKARRCWSPDLHRRFVNALQMLGGSQVATPKQIRELMKVEGLTNDEVKSHLQKYRLHTRRPGPNPQQPGPHSPHLVVLGVGGIWVPTEYAAAASQNGTPAVYGPSSHFYTTPSPLLPQEFYTATPPPHPQPSFPHPFHLYKKTTERSPESDMKERGERERERSESFEEDKSGSNTNISCGGNGDERIGKGLCGGRMEGCEESNRREISLRF